ncbi:TerC family protein [Planctomycetota bacterium]
MLELLTSTEAWIGLLTLAGLEIVLGIDNIVFITILAGKLPKEQQLRARRLGLALAMITRIALLFALSWVMGLNRPLFELFGHAFTGRQLVLLGGGLFLMGKAVIEIYDQVEAAHPATEQARTAASGSMALILIQIMLLDIVFSLDSVITAVGMVRELPIMVAAVVIAVCVMLLFAGPIGDFVESRPSVKILALSFLVMIGVLLVAEGTGKHLNKGYVYFGMAFSLVIELLNMRYRKRREALRKAQSPMSQSGRVAPEPS